MSVTPAPLIFESSSPMLSARVTELVQYLKAPLSGRLTDEQRSLSLSITRRIVTEVALKIDRSMDVDQLWSDWLVLGIPATSDLAALCFARCEEHRWRALHGEVDFDDVSPLPMMFSQAQDFSSAALHSDIPDLADAYLQLQIADRARFDNLGYPSLSINDLTDELHRQLLNEIARWRLGQISRDRVSSAALGEAVRSAWKARAAEPSITLYSIQYYQQLCLSNRMELEANDAIRRQDWLSFLAILSAAQSKSYSDTVLGIMALRSQDLRANFDKFGLSSENLGILDAALNALPGRVVQGGMRP